MAREYATYRNSEGTEVQVTTVREGEEGSVQDLSGSVVETRVGDKLVATPNPSVFVTGADLDGYSVADDSAPVEEPQPEEDPEFDPSANNADVVRRYLEKQKAEGNRDEFTRVVTAEQNDKNRASALVDYDK